MILKLYLILDGPILLRKGDFCCKVHLCNGFGGGILGGVRKIWGNPYLNSMTALFDNCKYVCCKFINK